MSISEDEDDILCWLLCCELDKNVQTNAIPNESTPLRRRRRRHWVHPIVSQRLQKGSFHKLYDDLRQHPEKFQQYCRMSIPTFDRLLECVRSGLTFQDTYMRRCISPEQRLIVTLRFLATGNSYSSLHFEFLLGKSTISCIVIHTCEVIWHCLLEVVMPEPKCADWLNIADEFYKNAHFPNCIGALDGKHIRVKKPPQSGSRYYNYKQYFSLVLLAVADSNYKFVLVDIGSFGSSADARIFTASRFGERLSSNQLSLPEPQPFPGQEGQAAPFVIVADEGFGLTPHVMRPFPRRDLDERKRIYNYRLTRARRYVECAFGILSGKWRVFMSSMELKPENATKVIQACVVLHNFIRIHESSHGIDLQDIEHTRCLNLDLTHHRRPGAVGLATRELYANYFISPQGSVSWQM